MSDDGHALAPLASTSPTTEADYDVIHAAVMETGRGRWFLSEYARRNRNADTRVLLATLERIEETVRRERASASFDRIKFDLHEMARAIVQTKAEIAAIRPDGDGRIGGASNELDSILQATETATHRMLQAAEQVQDLAWTLRERGVDPQACDRFDAHATEIYLACEFQDLTGQRTRKVIQVLNYLEERINAMVEIWGDDEAPPARAGKAPEMDQTDIDVVMAPPGSPMPGAFPANPAPIIDHEPITRGTGIPDELADALDRRIQASPEAAQAAATPEALRADETDMAGGCILPTVDEVSAQPDAAEHDAAPANAAENAVAASDTRAAAEEIGTAQTLPALHAGIGLVDTDDGSVTVLQATEPPPATDIASDALEPDASGIEQAADAPAEPPAADAMPAAEATPSAHETIEARSDAAEPTGAVAEQDVLRQASFLSPFSVELGAALTAAFAHEQTDPAPPVGAAEADPAAEAAARSDEPDAAPAIAHDLDSVEVVETGASACADTPSSPSGGIPESDERVDIAADVTTDTTTDDAVGHSAADDIEPAPVQWSSPSMTDMTAEPAEPVTAADAEPAAASATDDHAAESLAAEPAAEVVDVVASAAADDSVDVADAVETAAPQESAHDTDALQSSRTDGLTVEPVAAEAADMEPAAEAVEWFVASAADDDERLVETEAAHASADEMADLGQAEPAAEVMEPAAASASDREAAEMLAADAPLVSTLPPDATTAASMENAPAEPTADLDVSATDVAPGAIAPVESATAAVDGPPSEIIDFDSLTALPFEAPADRVAPAAPRSTHAASFMLELRAADIDDLLPGLAGEPQDVAVIAAAADLDSDLFEPAEASEPAVAAESLPAADDQAGDADAAPAKSGGAAIPLDTIAAEIRALLARWEPPSEDAPASAEATDAAREESAETAVPAAGLDALQAEPAAVVAPPQDDAIADAGAAAGEAVPDPTEPLAALTDAAEPAPVAAVEAQERAAVMDAVATETSAAVAAEPVAEAAAPETEPAATDAEEDDVTAMLFEPARPAVLESEIVVATDLPPAPAPDEPEHWEPLERVLPDWSEARPQMPSRTVETAFAASAAASFAAMAEIARAGAANVGPQTVTSDPLGPLMAMSDEERIALFS